jgi:hypothetical protein
MILHTSAERIAAYSSHEHGGSMVTQAAAEPANPRLGSRYRPANSTRRDIRVYRA